MTQNSELHQVEVTIEQVRKQIELMEALDRLRENRDFKTVISEGYLKDEAVSLVLSRAEPTLQEEPHCSQINKMIDGVGYFRQYLNKIYQMGNTASRALEEHIQTRDEILSED